MSTAEPGKPCPKCRGAMEEGFIPDGIGGLRAAKPSEWYKGPLELSFWIGVKQTGPNRVVYTGR